MANRLEHNYHISNKKCLFYNMRSFFEYLDEDPFQYIPVTFHIRNGTKDPEYQNFLAYYKQRQEQIEANPKLKMRNIWIIKPGEYTNRGNGISICKELSEIETEISEEVTRKRGGRRTYIVQQYIDKPFLYKKRKFDIRCFMLLTSVQGKLKGGT